MAARQLPKPFLLASFHSLSRLSSSQRGALPRMLSSSSQHHQQQKKVIFSGIQSTGIPTLGNYLGAIRLWKDLHAEPSSTELIFSVVDYHTLTVERSAESLRTDTRDTLLALIACGLDPDRCILFQQSQVPEHTELAWILSCIAPTSELNRMIQWKEKSKKKELPSLGLYSYPVLMAADILLYGTTHVPVGEDQTQHLELTRGIVQSFNFRYQTTYFKIPETIYSATPRIMSLRDPLKKMSKSDVDPKSRISLLDSNDDILQKVMKAVTDPISEIYYDETRPGVSNLLRIYSALSGQSTEAITRTYAGLNTAQFKEGLAAMLIQQLEPIRKEYARLQGDQGLVDHLLSKGRRAAHAKAASTLSEVKRIIGLTI